MKLTILELLIIVAVIGLLMAIAVPVFKRKPRSLAAAFFFCCLFFVVGALAQGQVNLTYPVGAPNFNTPDTNAIPITLGNGASTTFAPNTTNSLEKTVRQDHGMSVFVTIAITNSSAVGTLLGWDTTPDSSNYTTTQPLKWFIPGTFGTNTYWTNWPPTTLNNVRGVQLTLATNGAAGTGNTNSVRITSLIYSQSANQP